MEHVENGFISQQGVRRYVPEFTKINRKHPIARRFAAAINGHDWDRNRYLMALRRDGGKILKKVLTNGQKIFKSIKPMRLSIRIERQQTLSAMCLAMIYRTDFDPDAPYLFEVKASLEELARMIGQLHCYAPGYDGIDGQYTHGRKACDPVRNALEMLECIDAVVVVREFDHQAGTYKASRIFLCPTFFKMFGFKKDETKKMISTCREWQQKKGKRASNKEKRQLELLRVSLSDRIADLNRPSLKNLLTRIRREFLDEDSHTQEVVEANTAIKKELKKRELTDTESLERDIRLAEQKLPMFALIKAKQNVAKQLNVKCPAFVNSSFDPEFAALYLIELQKQI